MIFGIKKSKFVVLCTSFPLGLVLSGCGGGGSSGGSEGAALSSEVTISQVTEDNYLDLAKIAWRQVSSPVAEPEIPASAGISSQSLLSMAVRRADCDSGSGTENEFFQNPPTLMSGDYFESVYKSCKNNHIGGYSLTDGRVKANFLEVTGSFFSGGLGTYRADAIYDNWSLEFKISDSEPSTTIIFDGDISYDAERTATLNRWKQEMKRLSIKMKDDGVVTWSGLITDSSTEWRDNLAESTYTLKGTTDGVLGAESWFIFDVRFFSDLTGFILPDGSRETPSGGFVRILDNTSRASVMVTAQGNLALIECDFDGDGVVDKTQTVDIASTFL